MRFGIGIALLIVATIWGVDLSAQAAADVETAVVVIKSRQFDPARVVVHRGRKITLIVENHDSELHTFAPEDLFAKESFAIGGNGAPEFGPAGFRRVIIPPDGRAELEFTPSEAGEYRYACDMPGHQMRAVVVVER